MPLSQALADLPWVESFAQLGTDFYTRVETTPLTNPHWVHINSHIAESLGLSEEHLKTPANLEVFSGANPVNDQLSLAMVYAGHQFGGYSPQLGDGRGVLLGQLQLSNGLVDLHLKGAGRTPYSRFGDGRAVLRSSIREYLVGEAMYGLGIPTSRALCITASDDPVEREETETAAMVTRTAKTHIRFGHFEYFHYTQQFEHVQQLADHVIAQFLPEAMNQEDKYQQLLLLSVKSTALMIAKWQSVGFAHGVMNTDNMSIIGETLDYGPYAFMDDYEPGFIGNHSDHYGRYAFDQQPDIGLWNLNALGHALSSLLKEEQIEQALEQYQPILVKHFGELIRQKLGWETQQKQDHAIFSELTQLMAEDRVDYSLFFRRLCDFSTHDSNEALATLFQQKEKWQQWQQIYKNRLNLEKTSDQQRSQEMKQHNPKFILRNYLLQQAIEKAQQRDYGDIDILIKLAHSPYDEHPEHEAFCSPPSSKEKHLPISCSS